jgi:hypothetical protein
VHQISSHVISTVINPALGIEGPNVAGLPIVDHFDDQSSGVPVGWSIDPASVGGTSVAELNGGAAIQGPALASIVYNAPFNSQLARPITVTAELTSVSSDNFMGVFLTDNIGSRGFHVGALVDMSTKQISLNADNGNGFNPTQDRIILGTLPEYSGDSATLSFSYDEIGFSVEFDAGAHGSYASGIRPWSQVPGGFDPAKLGQQTQLFIQSFDVNGGAPASIIVDSISVTGTANGDFNGDGVVDTADYVVWRRNIDGGYTIEDYDIWRANFGRILNAAGSGSTIANRIPESTTLRLAGLCCCFALLKARNCADLSRGAQCDHATATLGCLATQ